ncbi:PaaI family thioesterase [Allorhizobium sp. BGMRC 0089]|uniref:PaaI family thioesterase n=1 Tax=Allorhizobium sonneratiae TaxID=2934936 RepID=UPI0020346A4A|nr:PaaI family thioesterase [Allorhizobium sonneratiae]MCM2291625.1 PaaI family thioesterase [Allorhizobium sonneratiae]
MDEAIRNRITASFARQGVMRLLSAQLTHIAPKLVEIEVPFHENLTQQHGLLHAGVISAALDAACSYAGYTVLDPDSALLTIEFKVNMMSPGRGERFLFRGDIVKPGSTIIVADGRGYSIGDGPAKLIASMTSTLMVIRGREDIRE